MQIPFDGNRYRIVNEKLASGHASNAARFRQYRRPGQTAMQESVHAHTVGDPSRPRLAGRAGHLRRADPAGSRVSGPPAAPDPGLARACPSFGAFYFSPLDIAGFAMLRRGIDHCNFSDLPLFDLIFGTFRNPKEFVAESGFDGVSSAQILDMLACRDVAAGDFEQSVRPTRPCASHT
jgi:hypothetical protein